MPAASRPSPALLLALTLSARAGQGQVIGTATTLAPGYIGGFSLTSFEVPLEKTGIGSRVSIIGWDAAGSGQ